jgi:outer membrane protein assembly factor BamB
MILGACGIGIFRAFDRQSGSVLWSYDIKVDGNQNAFHGDWLAANDLVLAGTDGGGEGHVYAWRLRTGEVAWKYAAGRDVASDIVGDGNRAFAVTAADELLAFDVPSGELLWRHQPRLAQGRPRAPRLISSPVVAGGRVVVSGRDGTVRAYVPSDGAVAWEYDLGTGRVTSPTAHSGAVYVATYERPSRVVRLDAATGAVLAERRLDTGLGYQPVAVDVGLIYYPTRADESREGAIGQIALLDPSLDRVLWSREAQDRGWTTPKPWVMDGVVFTGDAGGNVRGFRLTDGAAVVATQLDGGDAVRGIGGGRGKLYVGTLGGELHALQVHPD